MKRLAVIGPIVALLVGGGYVWSNYRFDVDPEGALTIRPVAGASSGGSVPVGQAVGNVPSTIRIATFHLDQLDERKLEDAQASSVLARVVTQFDIVAVQALRSGDVRVVQQLTDRVNAGGGQYDFVAYPTAVSRGQRQDVAMLFNRETVEVDRSTVRPVADPEGRFANRPLVAQFRVKGPNPGEAFTFVLVNVQIDPEAGADRDLIETVFRAVCDDQPAEDDVIVLGDLGPAVADVGPFDSQLTSAILDTPTTLEGSRPSDNVVFNSWATTEFTGRAEVLDLMREFDLTWREASAISSHLPVWVEFFSLEGGCGP